VIQTNTIYHHSLDFIVPFGPFLRRTEEAGEPFSNMKSLLHVIPLTFVVYWLTSLVPYVGTLIYILILVPLSARRHVDVKGITEQTSKLTIYLWYFTVISIGFGGLWSFIGHTFLADTVAAGIGWPAGSPFQTELAFYTLGSAIAGILATWLRGHMFTALVISKSIFLYGAAFVHIQDALVNQNYASLNIGAPLIGDLILPTVFLLLLFNIFKSGPHYPNFF
jgi:hypothetical protein